MVKLTTVLLVAAAVPAVSPVLVDAFSIGAQSQRLDLLSTSSPSSKILRPSPSALFMSPPAVDEEVKTGEMTVNGSTTVTQFEDDKAEDELSQTKKLMKQVKEAGTAGVISYALWELAFWFISVPVCAFGFKEVTGHWPDFSSKEDLEKLGAEAFAFVNFARFAVPLRIGLALSTTPWIDQNVVKKFFNKDGTDAATTNESS